MKTKAQKNKVAVIGAGALGLMALKQFKEDGFEVTGFESRPYIGGLWKDRDDSTITVLATTIFNTSKFRAAISDFPFPEEADMYPTAAQIYDYLTSYADHFDLKKHVQVNTKVKQILREAEQWSLEVEDVALGTTSTHTFDRVCVATGSFYKPHWPRLEGIETFQGKVLHSIDFHGSAPFKDENVLVLGMHSTAQDVTNTLSDAAKHVYLSHRHGVMLLPRFTERGEPSDTQTRMPFLMVQSWFETNAPKVWTFLLDKLLNKVSSKAYPDLPEGWGLRPTPSIAIATPLMADTIYASLESGFAEPVPSVKKITGPRSVELTNGKVLSDIDTILYCTGYHFSLPENLVPKPSSISSTSDPSSETEADPLAYDPYPNGPGPNPYLYLNIFPLTHDPAIRNTLAFLGHAATYCPGFVQFELQSAAVSQTWRGRRALPPHAQMLQWHAEHSAARAAKAKSYNAPAGGTFYPGMVDFGHYFSWLDDAAGTGLFANLGGKFNGLFNWRTWNLWWNDRELYDLVVKGILTPTVYRVFDMGGRKALPAEEAKKRLRRDNEVFDRAVERKRNEMQLHKAMKKEL